MSKIPLSRVLAAGFTLVEIMISMTIMVGIMLIVTSIINSSSDVWRKSSEKIESFQAARTGFDLLTRNLTQATLNTYYDYDNNQNPTRYQRNSELQFAIQGAGSINLATNPSTSQVLMFQAPLSAVTNTAKYSGMNTLLNACGYYIDFDKQTDLPPHVKAPPRYRYRLMQLLVPSESDSIYTYTTPDSASNFKWISDYKVNAQPVAENIVALILRPRDPDPAAAALSTDYTYDSRANWKSVPQPVTANQLPPIIEVTMIAITEKSALRMENGNSEPTQITAALAGKFTDTSKYDDDLKAVQTYLNSVKPSVEYRVFTSSVPLRETKWTK